MRARVAGCQSFWLPKEVAMKATGTFPKCRPASTGVATRAAPLHVPLRRAVATPVLRSGASDRQAGAGASRTEPLEPLILHRAPGTAPHILHIDKDSASALALATLLMPEVRVTHVPTLAAARAILRQQIFSAVVIDPTLPDGDAAELLPALTAIPLLVYSAQQPNWRMLTAVYLPKPWTSPRQLWTTIAHLLGIRTPTSAED
jgi:two-component system phosphate regulon response regulator OmpR